MKLSAGTSTSSPACTPGEPQRHVQRGRAVDHGHGDTSRPLMRRQLRLEPIDESPHGGDESGVEALLQIGPLVAGKVGSCSATVPAPTTRRMAATICAASAGDGRRAHRL